MLRLIQAAHCLCAPSIPPPSPTTEYAVRRFLERIADRYNIARAILYGSRARGTHQPDSDADVAVILRGEPGNAYRAIHDMAGTAAEVLLETGVDISPLPIWQDEWDRPETYPNPSLLRNIAADGVRL